MRAFLTTMENVVDISVDFVFSVVTLWNNIGTPVYRVQVIKVSWYWVLLEARVSGIVVSRHTHMGLYSKLRSRVDIKFNHHIWLTGRFRMYVSINADVNTDLIVNSGAGLLFRKSISNSMLIKEHFLRVRVISLSVLPEDNECGKRK